jgi:hypothetical protein
MKTLIFTIFLVTMAYGSSVPILKIKDISKDNECGSGNACVELSVMVLEEISSVKVILEKVDLDENESVAKVIDRKEESISASSLDALLYVVSQDANLAQSENYRINVEVKYLSGIKVKSGFRNVNLTQ